MSTGRYGAHDYESYERPRRRTRPRTKDRPTYDDAVPAVVVTVDRGRYTCRLVEGDQSVVTAMKSRPLGRKGVVVGDRVRLVGALPQAEVARVVAGAAAFAAPCVVGADGNRDGLPTVLLEAMALGTPCVATPVTGIPEVLRHGDTGLLVPERDPAALAAALDRLLDDAPLRTRLATAARLRVQVDFDARRQAAAVAAAFRRPPVPARRTVEVVG